MGWFLTHGSAQTTILLSTNKGTEKGNRSVVFNFLCAFDRTKASMKILTTAGDSVEPIADQRPV